MVENMMELDWWDCLLISACSLVLGLWAPPILKGWVAIQIQMKFLGMGSPPFKKPILASCRQFPILQTTNFLIFFFYTQFYSTLLSCLFSLIFEFCSKCVDFILPTSSPYTNNYLFFFFFFFFFFEFCV